jgi:hypothetical protein
MKFSHIIWLSTGLLLSCATETNPSPNSDNVQSSVVPIEDTTDVIVEPVSLTKLPPEEYAEQWDYFIMVIEDDLPFDWSAFVAIENADLVEIENNFRDPAAFEMINHYHYSDLPYAHYDDEEVKEILIGAVDAEGKMHGYYYYFGERSNGLRLVGWAAY